MENEQRGHSAETVDHRALAVALLDISADVRRKSHEDTGVRPLPNGAVDILRVVEGSPGITVDEVAACIRRPRQHCPGPLISRISIPVTEHSQPRVPSHSQNTPNHVLRLAASSREHPLLGAAAFTHVQQWAGRLCVT